eukprot:TRINITY_DN1887_c0_g1_i1.p1 TRINITY_DN1887_c0_g1~~TRINITY_DN1887_c0_g1_i1.p1  ORF type:complete len:248 (+),score=61.75 TRINITY_DN1887_c0_g1_i1:348-1091(+)
MKALETWIGFSDEVTRKQSEAGLDPASSAGLDVPQGSDASSNNTSDDADSAAIIAAAGGGERVQYGKMPKRNAAPGIGNATDSSTVDDTTAAATGNNNDDNDDDDETREMSGSEKAKHDTYVDFDAMNARRPSSILDVAGPTTLKELEPTDAGSEVVVREEPVDDASVRIVCEGGDASDVARAAEEAAARYAALHAQVQLDEGFHEVSRSVDRVETADGFEETTTIIASDGAGTQKTYKNTVTIRAS